MLFRTKRASRPSFRPLRVEGLEIRQTMNADFDDQMSESRVVPVQSNVPSIVRDAISNGTDVDMYRISVASGQTVDIDIDTLTNGGSGLGSFVRLFDSRGISINANNDAAAPGEDRIGFDSYLRHTFATGGTYYIGVSNWQNTSYNAITGNGDRLGNVNATGAYTLSIQAMPVDLDDSIPEAYRFGAVSTRAKTVSGVIDWDVDVDMYAIQVNNGQSVDIDIDTPTNGGNGLGSYLRLFDRFGNTLAWNNDGPAPGETRGFDSFIRYRFNQGGTYYVGVSNWINYNYNPNTGTNDTAGWQYTVGSYSLTLSTTQGSSVAMMAPTNPTWRVEDVFNSTTEKIESLSTSNANQSNLLTPETPIIATATSSRPVIEPTSAVKSTSTVSVKDQFFAKFSSMHSFE